MERPAVDVVVPFRGDDAERRAVLARLRALALRDGDTLTVVDNGPLPPGDDDPAVLHAPERPTSYFARNRGAERGRAPWILFLDADVLPEAGLLDAYFTPAPGAHVGVLAGGVHDERPDDLEALSLAARYAALKQTMSHDVTLRGGTDRWAYAQTANAMVRREAFAAAGGFVDDVRSGGDADLCFRLRAAGWTLEARPRAAVVHRNRTTLRALARQRARHGSGAGWLDARYPGVVPRRLGLGGAWWSLRNVGAAAGAAGRGDRDGAAMGVGEAVSYWAFELGRLLPNELRAPEPDAARSPRRAWRPRRRR